MNQRDIVVIGGSRGAFAVLRTLVSRLPKDLPAAVCIVLHIGRHESVLPELLSKWGPMPARHPVQGEPIVNGTVYVAPPGRHMVLSHGSLALNEGAAENFARPAADPLFRSAAVHYGSRVVGVVLSGDLDDGAAGLATVRAHGGFCIVQDPADCEAPSMPRAAMKSAGADSVTTVDDLARHIMAAIGGAALRQQEEPAMSSEQQLDLEARLAQQGIVTPEELDRIGVRSSLTCPDCGGALWRVGDDRPLRYRCHTGHAFNALSLADGYSKESENAIRAAIRAVHERVIFARERQRSAERTGDAALIGIEQARIEEGEKLIRMLRNAVSEELAHDL
ncbi:chemotaxis protein CheB [Paraburkholderia diazotrophica]|uniref:chemotaxis protein CheB n=1 Tax=Paraburkholderia diazotrophica TaxID=667676 RepID=UPI00316C31BA